MDERIESEAWKLRIRTAVFIISIMVMYLFAILITMFGSVQDVNYPVAYIVITVCAILIYFSGFPKQTVHIVDPAAISHALARSYTQLEQLAVFGYSDNTFKHLHGTGKVVYIHIFRIGHDPSKVKVGVFDARVADGIVSKLNKVYGDIHCLSEESGE